MYGSHRLQIGFGRAFQFLAKKIGVVEVVGLGKVAQNLAAFAAVNQQRHVAVFRADLAFVFLKAFGIGAEYGQIYVQHSFHMIVCGRNRAAVVCRC